MIFGHFLVKNFGFGYHGNGSKNKKKTKRVLNDLVLGENKLVQKVSLKSETMREKLCSIFTENRSFKIFTFSKQTFIES